MNSLRGDRSHGNVVRAVIICAVFLPMLVSSFMGCAHTVEPFFIIDTVGDTSTQCGNGPRYVRFISLLPAPITLHSESGKIYGEALPIMVNTYIPESRTKPFKLYAQYYIDIVEYKDSITIPVDTFPGNSLLTVSIFYDAVNRSVIPAYSNDSAKRFPRFPLANDSCYFRFMNGLPDLSPSPVVNVYIDSVLVFPLVPFADVKNYILVPTGTHNVRITSETDSTKVFYSKDKKFDPGEYYTGRLTGTIEGSTGKFTIDDN